MVIPVEAFKEGGLVHKGSSFRFKAVGFGG